jgi:hypothetical protein
MTRRIGLSLALSIIAMLLLATVALAAPQPTSVQLTAAAATKTEQGYVLAVRLRTADGKSVNEAGVRFYEVVDLLGAREMHIGDATTDGQGGGTLPYLPAQLGSHQIIARFAGRDQAAPAEGRTTFEATVAAPPYQAETIPLSGFSNVVTVGVGAIVLSVWALIAFALISTARGVRRGARDLGKGDHA